MTSHKAVHLIGVLSHLTMGLLHEVLHLKPLSHARISASAKKQEANPKKETTPEVQAICSSYLSKHHHKISSEPCLQYSTVFHS